MRLSINFWLVVLTDLCHCDMSIRVDDRIYLILRKICLHVIAVALNFMMADRSDVSTEC